ncbi:hypothetical protein [Propionispira arboris]|uniref:hypothetical protein n=1 Tax=Propionispira arboris TaxID=84035 RepID=UPI001FE17B88|nr:hypothetical protein [Propionispira arboris]
MPSSFLSEATAAVGIALINSVGNLGGFVGPYAVGYLKDLTGSIDCSMYVLAGFAILAGVLTILIPQKLIKIDATTKKQPEQTTVELPTT